MTDLQEVQQLLLRLCSVTGTPGEEALAAAVVRQEWEAIWPDVPIETDGMGNVTAALGNRQAARQVLLDAHLDQIGLVVTGIDDHGFLRIAPCGGVDRRVLPGSSVTVYGQETRRGIVCCLPPHLVEGGADKVSPVDQMYVDLGMDEQEAKALVSLGDRISLQAEPRLLLGSRITAAGLDNRAGVAALLRCAQLLKQKTLRYGVTFLFSSREETGCEGAQTAAYQAAPTEAVMVDVSFASQPGVPTAKSGKLGEGVMIGMAPSLDKDMTKTMKRLAQEQGIPYQMEIMGGKTGTNADVIGVTRTGVKTALLSIPQRYMHTTAEVVDLADVERVAQLLAAYLLEEGGNLDGRL
ncbi:MAG: M20/M25/M40 family metallo-hydrolase [Clostridiales bacterium]|jgi:putative aminopeptidase FrvX|nr:M20/M25/M40 family metallo-hydrolase [Clostridiales bacterium]